MDVDFFGGRFMKVGGSCVLEHRMDWDDRRGAKGLNNFSCFFTLSTLSLFLSNDSADARVSCSFFSGSK